ncbi:MAG: hypothetical protein FJW40_00415 [Acidobacteria bacterium]|nr:hypothetical protein [Acidobacteriota bacterium]
MKPFVSLLALATTLLAGDSFEAFGHRWTVPFGHEWRVASENGGQIIQMLAKRPQEKPRRPIQFALCETAPFSRVTIEADVRRNEGSLILVYAYRDESHFNYAHLSVDTGAKQPVHNGIFHVYGGDRVRISTEDGPNALPTTDWTPVKLTWDGRTGRVEVEVAGKPLPALQGVDLSIRSGRVGLGSFFETAQFRNVRIRGE